MNENDNESTLLRIKRNDLRLIGLQIIPPDRRGLTFGGESLERYYPWYHGWKELGDAIGTNTHLKVVIVERDSLYAGKFLPFFYRQFHSFPDLLFLPAHYT